MTLKTPLGRALGLGSAREGTDHWWAQRVSAVALVLLGCWFALSLVTLGGMSYEHVHTYVADPLNSVLLSLLCAALAYHSYLGVAVIIEDYVHLPLAKVAALIVSRFAHVLVAALSVYAVLRVGLGA